MIRAALVLVAAAAIACATSATGGGGRGDNFILREEIAAVSSIRFLTPSEATNKYGTGYTAGIIEVSTR